MVAAGLRTMIARSLTIIGERIIGAHRGPENHNPLSLYRLPIQIPAISQPPAVATYVAASASQCPQASSQAGLG
jgi:hypothetical protein